MFCVLDVCIVFYTYVLCFAPPYIWVLQAKQKIVRIKHLSTESSLATWLFQYTFLVCCKMKKDKVLS